MLAWFIASAHAEPYVPDNDAVVLERLPAAGAARELEPLRRAIRMDPTDLRAALKLSQGYLRIGRDTDDPRYISYAQAALSPWMRLENPPPAVLVLHATALQSSHRFDEALTLIQRALIAEPRNAQAWLTKATLLQVRGRFTDARQACQQLFLIAGQLIAVTCAASVDGMTGRLEPSYLILRQVAAASEDSPAEVGAWVAGQLAEMAVRLGDLRVAEQHFENGLRLAPEDAYLRASYADVLLLQGRHERAIDLVEGRTAQDVLLLQLAIATRRAGSAQAERWAEMFDARRRAVRADDNPHLREHARFLLDVLDRPHDSLMLARKNWSVQREPADVRLYVRAAARAKSAEDERVVRQWIRETGYQDRTLESAARLDQ